MRLQALLTPLFLCPLLAWAGPVTDDDPLGMFLQARTAEQAHFPQASVNPLSGTITPAAPVPTNPSSTNTSVAPNGVSQRALTMSDVVVTALGYLDRPYSFGGNSMDGGFDCSGFVLSLFQRSLGHQLPRTAAEQAQATQKIDVKELSPGDLVFFNTMRRKYSHVGIYVGDGRFIHSPRAGAKIRIESMHTSYWKKRFNGAHRVPVSI